MYVKIVDHAIKPEEVINQAKTRDSGCVVTYVGLIRDNSHGKQVKTVEYKDETGQAEEQLRKLAEDIKQKFSVKDLAVCHRVGVLNVNDINLVFAFACGHRQEGFAACQYAIDRFKSTLPTSKKETYTDGTVCEDWDN